MIERFACWPLVVYLPPPFCDDNTIPLVVHVGGVGFLATSISSCNALKSRVTDIRMLSDRYGTVRVTKALDLKQCIRDDYIRIESDYGIYL